MHIPFRCRSLVAALGLLGAAVAASPGAAQTETCPLVGEAAVSTAVGSPVHVPPFMVVDNGSSVQCVFEGDAVGDGVLVGRYPGFFGTDPVQSFGSDTNRVRMLLADGLNTGQAVTFLPVDGIGDAAAWVVPADLSSAPDSLGRLLVRRGPDAFVLGIQANIGANPIATVTSLAQVVLAASS